MDMGRKTACFVWASWIEIKLDTTFCKTEIYIQIKPNKYVYIVTGQKKVFKYKSHSIATTQSKSGTKMQEFGNK